MARRILPAARRVTSPHRVSLLTSVPGIYGVGIGTTAYLNRQLSSLLSTGDII